MNRKPLLALAALVPVVALFFAARQAASWRPVAMFRFGLENPPGSSSPYRADSASITASYVNTFPVETMGMVFDTRTGKKRSFRLKGERTVGVQKGFFWHANTFGETSERMKISVVTGDGKEKRFSDPSMTIQGVNNLNLRLLPESNRIVFLSVVESAYEWGLTDQKLRRKVSFSTQRGVLSRDARSYMFLEAAGFHRGDARTGKVEPLIPLRGARFFEHTEFSPYGRYALLDQPTKQLSWEVVDTSTGKALWRFDLPPTTLSQWTICDDESTIFIREPNEWQVRDLKTGALLRTLPTVRGTQAAASSPDGAILYSVSNGVLYRQRAR